MNGNVQPLLPKRPMPSREPNRKPLAQQMQMHPPHRVANLSHIQEILASSQVGWP